MASQLAVRTAAVRARFAKRQADMLGLATGIGAGLTIGTLERNGKLPVSVLGLPSKLGLGIIGLAAGAYLSGKTGETAREVGKSCLTCYAYAAGKSGAMIAGLTDFVQE